MMAKKVDCLLADSFQSTSRNNRHSRAFRLLLNPTGTVGVSSGSAALPTTLFVDTSGQIRSAHAGELSRAALLQRVRELQAR